MKLNIILETVYSSKMPTANKLLSVYGEGWHVAQVVASAEWAALTIEVKSEPESLGVLLLEVVTGIEAALEHDGMTCTRADWAKGHDVTALWPSPGLADHEVQMGLNTGALM